jgi:hypothetical protein
MAANGINRNFWFLKLFLFSFFINSFLNTYTITPQQKAQAKIFLGTSTISVGIFNLLLGTIFFAFAHHNEKDIPVTYEEKMFFVLRNFLPKEELNRLQKHTKNTAETQKIIGTIFLGLGLACITAGCNIFSLQDIIISLIQEK